MFSWSTSLVNSCIGLWIHASILWKDAEKAPLAAEAMAITSGMLKEHGLIDSIIEEPNDFGSEWQVLDTEPKLFVNAKRFPQFPDRCILPDSSHVTQRKLRTDSAKVCQAEAACDQAVDFDACVSDVLATGDLGMATASDF